MGFGQFTPAQAASIYAQTQAPPKPMALGLAGLVKQQVDAARAAAAPEQAAADAAKRNALSVNTAPAMADAGQASTAATTALNQVSDPSRFAASDESRNIQNGVVGYANSVMSGQSPLVTALQRQQGEAQGQGAIVSSALSNQNGLAPGLTQRNAQAAQAQLHGSIADGAQANDIQAQRSALDAAGVAANGMRSADQTQALGAGGQQLQGAGTLATAGQNAAGLDMSAQLGNQQTGLAIRGQDTQAAAAAAALAQAQNQWQQTNDANNSWWNKYALPALSLGATVGAGAIAGASKGGSPTEGEGGGYVDPYSAANGGMYTHG